VSGFQVSGKRRGWDSVRGRGEYRVLDYQPKRGGTLFDRHGRSCKRPDRREWLKRDALTERPASNVKLTFVNGGDGRFYNTAVYLRDDAVNRENMRRVQAYYAREDVPFDPERGFDPLEVVREEPVWAVEHGLIPHDFGAIATSANASNRRLRGRALERLAGLYGILGAHEEQIETSEKLLRLRPRSKSARRWLVHGLLLLDRADEAERYARELVQLDPQDARSRAFANR